MQRVGCFVKTCHQDVKLSQQAVVLVAAYIMYRMKEATGNNSLLIISSLQQRRVQFEVEARLFDRGVNQLVFLCGSSF